LAIPAGDHERPRQVNVLGCGYLTGRFSGVHDWPVLGVHRGRGDNAGAETRYRRAVFFDPDSAEGLKAQTIVTKLDRERSRKERKSARPQDDGEMVRVPAGEFTMGSNDNGEEKPPHRVYLDGFHIDKYEVTNGLYRLFMAATSRAAPSYWNDEKWNGAGQPVVGVSWHDADAYCKWAGKRLPTEAEWEKAARGTDGRKYPWGEQWDASRANSDESKLGETVPVGSYLGGLSPYGAHDMAGNVWEWVADWYDANYYKQSPERNPQGPGSGRYRVLRGGSWYYDGAVNLRSASRYRITPVIRYDFVGFRCARGL
jgi:iron(II)-dependent oxidoreductase